jgi:transposase
MEDLMHNSMKEFNAVVLPFIERQFPDDNYYFYQDNSPVHTGSVINQWFARNLSYYQLIHTPTKSPDLNPIEHVWAQIKINVAHNGLYANEDELWWAILDAWNRLREDPNFATNLVNSMG